MFDKRKKGTKSLLLIIILYIMRIVKDKIYSYLLIIGLSVLLGLLSYPFHKSSDFKLFKSLPHLDNFKIDQDITKFEINNCDMMKSIKKQVNFIELQALNDLGCINIIDARELSEIYDEKISDSRMMIPNAISIPVGNIELIESEGYFDDVNDMIAKEQIKLMYEKEFESIDILNKYPRDAFYVIYCGSKKCDKSKNLAEYMMEYFNYQNISLYKGGWEDWRKNSLE